MAPTFLHSRSMIVAQIIDNEILSKNIFSIESFTENERLKNLEDLKVKLLVCGGIDARLMEELKDRGIRTINNVAGEVDEVLNLLIIGNLKPEFGISYRIPAHKKDSRYPKTINIEERKLFIMK